MASLEGEPHVILGWPREADDGDMAVALQNVKSRFIHPYTPSFPRMRESRLSTSDPVESLDPRVREDDGSWVRDGSILQTYAISPCPPRPVSNPSHAAWGVRAYP